MLNVLEKTEKKTLFRAYCFLYWFFAPDFSLNVTCTMQQIGKTTFFFFFFFFFFHCRKGIKYNSGKIAFSAK